MNTHTHTLNAVVAETKIISSLEPTAQILYYSIKCLSKFSKYPEKVLSFSKYGKLINCINYKSS